jgi:hypothetical protein
MGKTFFPSPVCPDRIWFPLSLLFNGFFSRGKAAGVKLITHQQLVLKLRMSGVIHLLPLYALMAWTGQTSPIFYIEINIKLSKFYLFTD